MTINLMAVLGGNHVEGAWSLVDFVLPKTEDSDHFDHSYHSGHSDHSDHSDHPDHPIEERTLLSLLDRVSDRIVIAVLLPCVSLILMHHLDGSLGVPPRRGMAWHGCWLLSSGQVQMRSRSLGRSWNRYVRPCPPVARSFPAPPRRWMGPAPCAARCRCIIN